MTEIRKSKKCKKKLRHSEHYSQTYIYDRLYEQSQKGKIFTDLMSKILSQENILLAYRNIKKNKGSNTAGTDGKTMQDIAKLEPAFVVKWVRRMVNGSANNNHGYVPRTVRRVNIPKTGDPTKTRPLGIPCIGDRLIQQCILQVLEPICEAKFSNNSYGFRLDRSTRHAIARTYFLINRNGLHHIIEFDIKGFFDTVDHSKLIRQIWAMGIRDDGVQILQKCER